MVDGVCSLREWRVGKREIAQYTAYEHGVFAGRECKHMRAGRGCPQNQVHNEAQFRIFRNRETVTSLCARFYGFPAYRLRQLCIPVTTSVRRGQPRVILVAREMIHEWPLGVMRPRISTSQTLPMPLTSKFEVAETPVATRVY